MVEVESTQEQRDPRIWVVTLTPDDDAIGRIGDARDIADGLETRVAVLSVGERVQANGFDDELARLWIAHGADDVRFATVEGTGHEAYAHVCMETAIQGAVDAWRDRPPRLILASADRLGRAWAARIAARCGWRLVSPALLVRARAGRISATALDTAGRRARTIDLSGDQTTIVALRPGVAQPRPADAHRHGDVSRTSAIKCEERTHVVERVPADPAIADIRHLPRLIAGGRGVGSRTGFDRLRRVAEKLGAGVAASRVAVDLGWIDYDRQVGQTGKTVQPELYVACGISGASHHFEGMSRSRHIVAINSDPHAPLMATAHLSLVGDLHAVLEEFEQLVGEQRAQAVPAAVEPSAFAG